MNRQHRTAIRAGGLLSLLTLAGVLGCSRGGPGSRPDTVGKDLPTVSSHSVALPGATDAADAPHSPSVAESHSATLTEYRDPVNGVRFLYPTVWRPAQQQTLPAPAFSSLAGPAKITQQFSPVGNVYASTVLRALTFSYTIKGSSDARSCSALPGRILQTAKPSRQVQYNGVTYSEAQGGDAGMCTQVQATIDTTLRGTQCLVFERDFITTCPYVKSKTLPRPLTDQEQKTLQQHLDAVMGSVTISQQ